MKREPGKVLTSRAAAQTAALVNQPEVPIQTRIHFGQIACALLGTRKYAKVRGGADVEKALRGMEDE